MTTEKEKQRIKVTIPEGVEEMFRYCTKEHGLWFSGEIVVVGGQLDWMILEVLSNLGDPVILRFYGRSKKLGFSFRSTLSVLADLGFTLTHGVTPHFPPTWTEPYLVPSTSHKG